MNQKKRIGLTYKKNGELKYTLTQELYKDLDSFDDIHHEPYRIIRDNTIKEALKISIHKLLKAEDENCSKLLSAYIKFEKTWNTYKYYVGRNFIWCAEGSSYAPYEELVEDLDDEWDLLVEITDKAWKWIANDNFYSLDDETYNNIFEELKIIKDKALSDYFDNVKESKIKYRSMSQECQINKIKLHNEIDSRRSKLIYLNTPIPMLKHLCLEKIKGTLLPFMESYEYTS